MTIEAFYQDFMEANPQGHAYICGDLNNSWDEIYENH